MKFAILSLLCFAMCPAIAQEQNIKPGSETWISLFDPPYEKPTELPVDMPLRKQLFDTLRPKVEKIAKEPARFEGRLRVYKNWALFTGRALNAQGESLALPDLGNDDTAALWLRSKDGWKLIEYSAGHSDAFYLIWPDQYGMPKELLE